MVKMDREMGSSTNEANTESQLHHSHRIAVLRHTPQCLKTILSRSLIVKHFPLPDPRWGLMFLPPGPLFSGRVAVGHHQNFVHCSPLSVTKSSTITRNR